jgi:hypothetical protein
MAKLRLDHLGFGQECCSLKLRNDVEVDIFMAFSCNWSGRLCSLRRNPNLNEVISFRTCGRPRRRGRARYTRARSGVRRSRRSATSGFSRHTLATPSGAARRQTKRISFAPRIFRSLIAAFAESGREHRVHEDHEPLGEILRRLEIIFDRGKRVRTAIESDGPPKGPDPACRRRNPAPARNMGAKISLTGSFDGFILMSSRGESSLCRFGTLLYSRFSAAAAGSFALRR